ncbi:hypothetical protein A134_22740 [Vibrio crassostreae 9CS106]|nr:hypothetical protein A134_22740 [Vibrio crassostreae 9CS106]
MAKFHNNSSILIRSHFYFNWYNSALYPIIYAQALHASGKQSSQGAAILIMCSIGGVILPFAQASLIDEMSLSTSYIAPTLAYLLMVALYWASLKHRI